MNQLKDPKTRRRAFEQLVNQYSEQLYWQVRRIVLTHDDANDVLQNVFLKAWSKLDTFHQESKISTWLYRIALNESLDFMRKKKTQMVSTDDDEMTVGNTLMADEYFSGTEVEAMLQEAIAQLPAPTEELKGKVMDCTLTGYKLNDKVIRHAQVVVGS